MIFASMLNSMPVPLLALVVAGGGANWRLLTPVFLVCLTIVVSIPAAAARSKLHMPAYIGIALLAFVMSFVFGEISGAHGIKGSIAGIVLSMACFLSIAAAVGSILALVFYHDPPAA